MAGVGQGSPWEPKQSPKSASLALLKERCAERWDPLGAGRDAADCVWARPVGLPAEPPAHSHSPRQLGSSHQATHVGTPPRGAAPRPQLPGSLVRGTCTARGRRRRPGPAPASATV